MRSETQARRVRQYAVCSYALTQDRITDGAEGVFDQALTNGLAAIVAAEWPGAETQGASRIIRSARPLLGVIEQKGTPGGDGVIHLLRAGGPTWLPPIFGDEPAPNFTVVEVAKLRDALAVTSAIRHARDADQDEVAGLSEVHIDALVELAHHPALYSMDITADRAEGRLHDADAVERQRAAAYYASLDEEEQRLRESVDYEERYGYLARDGRCEVEVSAPGENWTTCAG